MTIVMWIRVHPYKATHALSDITRQHRTSGLTPRWAKEQTKKSININKQTLTNRALTFHPSWVTPWTDWHAICSCIKVTKLHAWPPVCVMSLHKLCLTDHHQSPRSKCNAKPQSRYNSLTVYLLPQFHVIVYYWVDYFRLNISVTRIQE